jgi:dynactin complex subunit
MLIEVKRFEFKDTHTIGKMYVDGVYECYTLEDVVRNGTKVLGKTAIPTGEYKLIIDASVRFKQDMPHILNVLNMGR